MIPDRTARSSRPFFGQSDRNSPRSDLTDKPEPYIFNLTTRAAPFATPFRKNPSQISFEDTLSETFRTPSRPFATSPNHLHGKPLRNHPPSKTLFRSRFEATSGSPLRKPVRKATFQASSGKSFEPTSPDDSPSETLRNQTRVPEARPISLPEPTRTRAECLLSKPLPKPPLPDHPSGGDTCPECRAETIFPDVVRVRHASRSSSR